MSKNVDMNKDWALVKKIFNQATDSSGHHALASVNADGTPHITPIGSLVLGKTGKGFYFERFTTNMPKNFETNNQVCVLAVNGSKWFWLKAILFGHFASPPAVRLLGEVGEKREATKAELALWHKRVGSLSFTKGYKEMWAGMSMVREITFTDVKPVYIGNMTRGLYEDQ